MPKKNDFWFTHEPSTYSYLGRNDNYVNWMLYYRKQKGLPPPKAIVVIGSGVIEPFTIAALPLALQSQIIAIEFNSDLFELAQAIKKGKKISWLDIAKKSQHPGAINTQLTDLTRLSMGIKKLASLGSLVNLGSGLNNNFFQVADSVADRISFIPNDALSVLKSLSGIDLIFDFFVQVNINKDREKGIYYTRQMTKAAISALTTEGSYMIGDSGRNTPITLNHINDDPEAKLNISVLVHAVNHAGKYSSSYYFVLGKKGMESSKVRQTMQKNISDVVTKYKLPVREQIITVSRLSRLSASHLYFGFIGNVGGKDGIVWYCPLFPRDVLFKLVPSEDKVFTDEIIFQLC